MRHHPIRVGAPRDIVPPPSHDAATPPALLQRSDDDFVESTIEDLRTAAGRASLRTKLAAARNTAHVLKLFQPLQRQFHLAVIEAWCDTAGTPRIDPARVDSAGLVLRRIRGTGSAQFLEAWVKSSGRLRGWVRVAQHTEQAPPLADTPAGATPGQPVDRSRAHPLRARARGCAARRARRAALHGAARRLRRSEEDALLRAGADSERRDCRRPRRSGPGARHRFRSRVGRLHGAPGRPAARPADDVRARRRDRPPGLVRGGRDAGRGQAAGPAVEPLDARSSDEPARLA